MGGQKTRPLSKNGHAKKKTKMGERWATWIAFFFSVGTGVTRLTKNLKFIDNADFIFRQREILMKAHFSYQYFSYFIICLVVCVCLGGGAGGIMKFLMGLWKRGGEKRNTQRKKNGQPVGAKKYKKKWNYKKKKKVGRKWALAHFLKMGGKKKNGGGAHRFFDEKKSPTFLVSLAELHEHNEVITRKEEEKKLNVLTELSDDNDDVTGIISASICRRPSWTPDTQPNGNSAVVWLRVLTFNWAFGR